MKHLKTFFVTLCILALPGCFDVHQTLTVPGDGSASMEFEISLDASLLKMAENLGEEEKPFSCSDAMQEEPVEGLAFEHKEFDRGGDRVCAIVVTGALERFAELKFKSETQDQEDAPVKLVTNESGTITATFPAIGQLSSGLGEREGAEEGAAFAAELMEALFAGRSVTIEVSAPEVVSSNGTVSEDGRTATWTKPLSELVAGTAGDPFYVEFRPSKSFWDRFRSYFK